MLFGWMEATGLVGFRSKYMLQLKPNGRSQIRRANFRSCSAGFLTMKKACASTLSPLFGEPLRTSRLAFEMQAAQSRHTSSIHAL